MSQAVPLLSVIQEQEKKQSSRFFPASDIECPWVSWQGGLDQQIFLLA